MCSAYSTVSIECDELLFNNPNCFNDDWWTWTMNAWSFYDVLIGNSAYLHVPTYFLLVDELEPDNFNYLNHVTRMITNGFKFLDVTSIVQLVNLIHSSIPRLSFHVSDPFWKFNYICLILYHLQNMLVWSRLNYYLCFIHFKQEVKPLLSMISSVSIFDTAVL